MGKNKTFEEIENAMTHQTSISQNSIEMEYLFLLNRNGAPYWHNNGVKKTPI